MYVILSLEFHFKLNINSLGINEVSHLLSYNIILLRTIFVEKVSRITCLYGNRKAHLINFR